MVSQGRNCDNCEKSLNEDDFVKSGSWSYDCPHCGFKYRHGSSKTASEQVDSFLENDIDHDSAHEPENFGI